MVDVIKFYIEEVNIPKNVLIEKFDIYTDTIGNAKCYYKKEAFEKYHSIKFLRLAKKEDGKLEFERNIRKDYFNRTRTIEADYIIATSDLSYYDFVKEVEFWSTELKIDKKIFWKAKVTQIELGVTLYFNNPMLGIFSCFGSLKDIPRKHIYENSGVKFIGDNYQVSIYDKWDRAFATGEIFKKTKTINRNKVREKVKKIKAFIRYEIKITNVSGSLPKGLRKVKYLEDIRSNWNDLANTLLIKFDDFTFVDVISPKIEKEIIYQQFKKPIEGNKRRQNTNAINEYLKYLGLETITMEKFFQYVYPLVKQKTKVIEKGYIDTFEKFIEKRKPTYSDLFKKVLKRRLKSIKKKDKIPNP